MMNTKTTQTPPAADLPEATPGKLGPALRVERESRGWTLDRLAKELHVSKGYLSRLEGGKAKPATRLIERLAILWQIDPDPLLILAGHVPVDVQEILQNHPLAAPSMLRHSFGAEALESRQPAVSTFVAR